MVNFGTTQNVKWEGSGQDVRIEHYNPEHAMTKNFKYMFQKLSEKFRGLCENTYTGLQIRVPNQEIIFLFLIIFLMSNTKHMLWVLKRTISMRRFF